MDAHRPRIISRGCYEKLLLFYLLWNLKNCIGVADLQKQEEQDDHHRSYGPSSSRHKRQNLGAVAGAPDLSLPLKFSEIVLYKFTLALVDFVFTFLFIHTFK